MDEAQPGRSLADPEHDERLFSRAVPAGFRQLMQMLAEPLSKIHRVDLRNDYPEDQIHLISFDVAPGKLNYLIDAKARLCYFRWTATANAVSMTQVPCRSLKEGYPIMAPIIDWEK